MRNKKVEKAEKPNRVGKMKKRQVQMADNRRYLIYYTFGNGKNEISNNENKQ